MILVLLDKVVIVGSTSKLTNSVTDVRKKQLCASGIDGVEGN